MFRCLSGTLLPILQNLTFILTAINSACCNPFSSNNQIYVVLIMQLHAGWRQWTLNYNIFGGNSLMNAGWAESKIFWGLNKAFSQNRDLSFMNPESSLKLQSQCIIPKFILKMVVAHQLCLSWKKNVNLYKIYLGTDGLSLIHIAVLTSLCLYLCA